MRNIGYLRELKIEKARERRIKRFSNFFIPTAFLLLSAYIFIFSGIFEVKGVNISITPNNRDDIKIKSSEILDNYLEDRILKIITRKNSIFLVSKNKIAGLLSNIYPIAEVNTKKNISDDLIKIDISLRKEAGVWCNKNYTCLKFDEKGFLFEIGKMEDVFLVRDLRGINIKEGGFLDKNLIDAILESKKAIDFLSPFQVKEFIIPEYSVGEFWIETKEGWLVYLDYSVDVKAQIVAMEKLLEEQLNFEQRDNLEYIDLRIDGRMYYKLENLSE